MDNSELNVVKRLRDDEAVLRAAAKRSIVNCIVQGIDADGNLAVTTGKYDGVILRKDIFLKEEPTDDKLERLLRRHIQAIITYVEDIGGDPRFKLRLSRAAAMEYFNEKFLSDVKPGDIIKANVESITEYGIFCDIGYGLSGMLPMDSLCIAPVMNAPKELGYLKELPVVYHGLDNLERVVISHRELLSTWDQAIKTLRVGDTVIGRVINTTSYGTFIAVGDSLKGLADISEITSQLNRNDRVAVQVVGVRSQKLKLRLKVVKKLDPDILKEIHFEYKYTGDRIKKWVYSPKWCTRLIETTFEG